MLNRVKANGRAHFRFYRKLIIEPHFMSHVLALEEKFVRRFEGSGKREVEELVI